MHKIIERDYYLTLTSSPEALADDLLMNELGEQVSFNQHTQKCTWSKGSATDLVAQVQNEQLLLALRLNKHGASAKSE